jgi:hypothetical protein
MPQRKPIKDSIKLLVRQKCGFGCIVCGDPIVEYHHITEHAKGGDDTVENLALLCPTHHSEHHKGILKRKTLENFAANPFSLRSENRKPIHLEIDGLFPIIVGNTSFGYTRSAEDGFQFSPIQIADDYEPFTFTVEDGKPLLSLRYIDAGGRTCLEIQKNEIVYNSGVFDFYIKSNRIELFLEKRVPVLKITLEDDFIRIREFVIFYKGILLVCNEEDGIYTINNNSIIGSIGIISSMTKGHQIALSIPREIGKIPVEYGIMMETRKPDTKIDFKKLQIVYNYYRRLPFTKSFKFS